MKPTIALIVLLSALSTAVPCMASQKLGGIIRGQVRLTPDDGPYRLERDLLVARSGTLTIMAGTRILVGKPLYYDDSIPQIDAMDSQYVSIKVQGIVRFLGKRNNRIAISAANRGGNESSWYGIIIEKTGEAFNEIAFTDIADACFAITVSQAKPVIRNCVIEFNNIGIRCRPMSAPRISNCFIGRNLSTGILVSGSNPVITGSIIAFNHNNGIWCEDQSKLDLTYNCIYGNGDGNLYLCDPAYGVAKKVNENKDSVDAFQNLFYDPTFAGTAAERDAYKRDILRRTKKNAVVDTALAAMVHEGVSGGIDSLTADELPRSNAERFTISRYSPCKNGGNPAKQYKDPDGSRNDIGIFGGPDFIENKE